MRGDDRGQLSTPVWFYTVPIALAVVSVVVLVGMDVANEFSEGVNESAFEQAAENTTTVCNGIAGGCGGTIELLPVAAVVMAAVVFVGFLRFATGHGTRPTDRNPTDGKSEVEILKDAYVEGDIQTTVKLESDLEALLDADIDDRDVQELDDLLGLNDCDCYSCRIERQSDNGDESDEQ